MGQHGPGRLSPRGCSDRQGPVTSRCHGLLPRQAGVLARIRIADDRAMVWCRLGDTLQWPDGALAGRRPSGLDGRAVRAHSAGGRDNDRCVEDLRGSCCDRQAGVGLRVPQPSRPSPSDTVPLHPEASGSDSNSSDRSNLKNFHDTVRANSFCGVTAVRVCRRASFPGARWPRRGPCRQHRGPCFAH